MKKAFLFFVLFLSFFISDAQLVYTIGGGGSSFSDGISATNAELVDVTSLIIDSHGDVFFTDKEQNRIRRIDTAGIITTFAGTGDATFTPDGMQATATNLNNPWGLTIDSIDEVFYTDGGCRVRKIDTLGIVTTVAGIGTFGYNGDSIPATQAALWFPYGITFNKKGNLIICDGQSRIRKINSLGIISTIAGNGWDYDSGYDGQLAINAQISQGYYIVTDNLGNVYFSEYEEHRIRKIDTFGYLTTVAGTGVRGYDGDSLMATMSRLNFPGGLAIDKNNDLIICDGTNCLIRKVLFSDGSNRLITIAGTGIPTFNGNGLPPLLSNIGYPIGILVEDNSNIIYSQSDYNLIREIKNTLGINILALPPNQTVVYPNPGNIEVVLQNLFPFDLHWRITDMNGRRINEGVCPGFGICKMQTERYPPGTYVLTSDLPDGSQETQKIIIHH